MAKIADFLEGGDTVVASTTWQGSQVLATRRGTVIGIVALDYGRTFGCVHVASVEQFLVGEDIVAISPMDSRLFMVSDRGTAFVIEGVVDRPHTLRVGRVMEN